jgi:hypothetical protein
MGESFDNSPGDSEKSESHASKSAGDNNLPMVEAPKLDGEQTAEAADGDTVIKMPSKIAAAPPPRASRFAQLAATIALAAALGSFIGTLSAVGIMRFSGKNAASAQTAEVSGLQKALKSQFAELAAIKSNLASATHSANGEFAKIADRLSHVETAQADLATKPAHVADTVDQKNTVAPEITGSIPGASTSSEPKATDRVLPNWIVEEVHGGRALVASRFRGEFLVAEGGSLPGLGRVETIKRQYGQWVVVTERGMIASER